ncbi:MAG: hypothetical protein ACJA2S_005843, partial [Cyclobacteriaceae bacterium]
LLQRLPTSLPLFDSYIVMVWQISAENTFDKRFIKGLKPFHKSQDNLVRLSIFCFTLALVSLKADAKVT